MANNTDENISIADYLAEQESEEAALSKEALDHFAHELAAKLQRTWNYDEDDIIEYARNLILGEEELSDNAEIVEEDDDGLRTYLDDTREQYKIIKQNHFLLLAAPLTQMIKKENEVSTVVSQEEERELRAYQYRLFCRSSPLLADRSNYSEEEVTHEKELFRVMDQYMESRKSHLCRNIIFNGHGTKDGRFCLEQSGKKTYVLLDQIIRHTNLLHEKHSVEQWSQVTKLHFIQCWGHKFSPELNNGFVEVISFTDNKRWATRNMKTGHSALKKLAKWHVTDSNRDVLSDMNPDLRKHLEQLRLQLD